MTDTADNHSPEVLPNKKVPLPLAVVRAKLEEIMDEVDARYEAQVADPLAAGWRHMQESRGWK